MTHALRFADAYLTIGIELVIVLIAAWRTGVPLHRDHPGPTWTQIVHELVRRREPPLPRARVVREQLGNPLCHDTFENRLKCKVTYGHDHFPG